MVDSLRERISHGAKAGCPPLLPQITATPHVNGKRRPMSPCTPRAGTHGRHSCSRLAAAARLLASRRFLAGALALTLVLNAAMRLPASWRGAPADYSDPAALSGDATPAVTAAASAASRDASVRSAKLIPRILHHAYPSASVLTPAARKRLQSWRVHNPGWEVRHYDNQACLDFVRREFPQYLDVYRHLTKVERSDLFRYLVVLRHGGVYADVDAECRAPLDALIASSDTLLAGWEADFGSPEAALDAWFVRSRQLAQWAFAAAGGHPALRDAADRIAAAVRTHAVFSADPELNAAERTGAGLFTDVVLAHAAAHPPSDREDPWGVRLLPRVALGTPPRAPAWGLSPSDPGAVALLHRGRGAWRRRARPRWAPWVRLFGGGDGGAAGDSEEGPPAAAATAAREWPSLEVRAAQLARMRVADAAQTLYPVSAAFQPPFDLLTHRAGGGERRAGQDVGAALTRHGSWQPSVQPLRRPSLADALVGSLGGAAAGRLTLLDVGAGHGLLSLAAAARGHRAIAFELAPRASEALEAAIGRNGFGHLVQLRRLPLGAPHQQGYVCLEPRRGGGGGAALPEALRADMARGYATPAAHATPAEACRRLARRTPGAAAVGDDEQVGAIHVSANGWEGWVLEGLAPLIERQRPPVVALEWSPPAMRAAGYARPLRPLQWLHGLGYSEASHSGYICDERWYAVTYGVRRRGGARPEELAALRQPTWCRLAPEHWQLLLERGGAAPSPETLLLVNRGAGNGTGGGGGGALHATAQQGHAARSWRQRQQQEQQRQGQGGALASASEEEEAELEAGVAATLAALARVEQALLRPGGRQRQQRQQQGSDQSAAMAAASTTAGGGGSSRMALGAGGAAAAGGAASVTQQTGAGLVRAAGLPPEAQQQQQQPVGLPLEGADSGHAHQATPAAKQQR